MITTSTSISTSTSQVASSGSLPSYLQNTTTSQRIPGSNIPYSADHSVALIISFPSKFPSQGSPSFTVRGSGVCYILPPYYPLLLSIALYYCLLLCCFDRHIHLII